MLLNALNIQLCTDAWAGHFECVCTTSRVCAHTGGQDQRGHIVSSGDTGRKDNDVWWRWTAVNSQNNICNANAGFTLILSSVFKSDMIFLHDGSHSFSRLIQRSHVNAVAAICLEQPLVWPSNQKSSKNTVFWQRHNKLMWEKHRRELFLCLPCVAAANIHSWNIILFLSLHAIAKTSRTLRLDLILLFTSCSRDWERDALISIPPRPVREAAGKTHRQLLDYHPLSQPDTNHGARQSAV